MERHYRVCSPRFCCAITVVDGKVDARQTAPYLKRLGGITEVALMAYARRRGWQIEPVKEGPNADAANLDRTAT